MFDVLKSRLGLEPKADHWFMDKADEIGALLQIQLKTAHRGDFISWGLQGPLILGYACGAAEHLCEQLGMRKRAVQLTHMVLRAATGLSEDKVSNVLQDLQAPLDPQFDHARRTAWYDWGMRHEVAADGLVQLLRTG